MALVSNKDKEMCNINHSKLRVHEPELAQATGSEVKEVTCVGATSIYSLHLPLNQPYVIAVTASSWCLSFHPG